MTRKPKLKALIACARWLSYCKSIGWRNEDLDALEALLVEVSRRPRRTDMLNGFELDRSMREILMAATRETVISSAAALVELGFGGACSFNLVVKAIEAKEAKS